MKDEQREINYLICYEAQANNLIGNLNIEY